MKSLPDRQQEVIPTCWAELYAQQKVELSTQNEIDITERLTRYFELLDCWNRSLNKSDKAL